MNGKALLVIDMQRFFFEENSDLESTGIVANCSELIDIARKKFIPVIHINTIYRKDMVDWPSSWKISSSWCSNLVEGKPTALMVDGLNIQEGDFHVTKKRFSAFFNTNLDDLLRSLKVGEVFLIGYSADVCVRLTAVDAYNRSYNVTLVKEAVESFRETKEQSICYLEWLINAKCISKNEFESLE